MSYKVFCDKVQTLVSKVGGISVRFFHDQDKGRYFAYCSGGVTLVGNSMSTNVLVKWGSQHRAVAGL